MIVGEHQKAIICHMPGICLDQALEVTPQDTSQEQAQNDKTGICLALRLVWASSIGILEPETGICLEVQFIFPNRHVPGICLFQGSVELDAASSSTEP